MNGFESCYYKSNKEAKNNTSTVDDLNDLAFEMLAPPQIMALKNLDESLDKGEFNQALVDGALIALNSRNIQETHQYSDFELSARCASRLWKQDRTKVKDEEKAQGFLIMRENFDRIKKILKERGTYPDVPTN